MESRSRMGNGHDRPREVRPAGSFPTNGAFNARGRELARWFRSLERDLRRVRLLLAIGRSPEKWRRLLVPVLVTTRRPAPTEPRHHGHFLI